MTKIEFFKYSLNKRLPIKLKWGYALLTAIEASNYKDEIIVIKDNEYFVIIEEEEVKITDYIPGQPLFTLTDVITLTSDDMKCIDSKVETTIGIAILNYVLLEYPFDGIIKYIDTDFKIGNIIDIVVGDLNMDKITVPQYKKFINSCTFLEGYSRITTVSATRKNILPPTGLKEFKTKLYATYNKKYGPDWGKDSTIVVKYENELKDFYEEFIKDDPSNNKFLAGKIKNNAVLKKYLTFGQPAGFEEEGDEKLHVENSLLEGYPDDPALLAKMFNSSRSGSYSRGAETQKGGVMAKVSLRATSSVEIVKGDCGVKYGKKILFTKDNHQGLIGRYIKTSSGWNAIKDKEEASTYIGKEMEVRSPLYCKTKGSNFCSVCVGELTSKYPNGVSIIVSDLGSVVLNTSLKKMHQTILKSVKFDITEAFR